MESQAGSGFNPQAGPEPYKYQYWYAKQTSVSGRSAESSAFVSEFYVQYSTRIQPSL
eukprot:COSAG02_NODE_2865_length_7868_cov_42.736002_9_plen_57_part_00